MWHSYPSSLSLAQVGEKGHWRFGLRCTKADGTGTVPHVASERASGAATGWTQDNILCGVFLLGFVPSIVLLSKGKSFWGKYKEKSLCP